MIPVLSEVLLKFLEDRMDCVKYVCLNSQEKRMLKKRAIMATNSWVYALSIPANMQAYT